MIWYGKLGQTAVAAASCLAGHYDEERLISATEISKARNLSHPLVAKVLTVLSGNKVVSGMPGPKGGYRLSRSPFEISLFDLVRPFQDFENKHLCPFGPDWCGIKDNCPLHDMVVNEREASISKMKSTTLGLFAIKP